MSIRHVALSVVISVIITHKITEFWGKLSNFVPAIMITEQDKLYVREALARGTDFVLISEPGSDDARLLTDVDGFFAAPWLQTASDQASVQAPELWRRSTPRQEYIASVGQLIEQLQETGGKTVISRVICGGERVDTLGVTEQYFAMNRSAFCCLMSLRGVGTWLMATPELLLQADGTHFATMALAGTRPAGSSGPWSEKNVEEQRMVTDFIVATLRALDLQPTATGPSTRCANRVEHLCTMIDCPAAADVTFADVANALSPTPALCGLPRELSAARIAAIERHPRQLYGGYVGWTDKATGVTRAWVVLRCARIEADGWCVYAGGGITAQSDAADEWRETTLKSAALVSLLSPLSSQEL
jgi:isochorismate synthase EntC